MTTGIRALRKIQIGREVTPGTFVPATLVFRGLGGMPDDQRTVIFPEEDIGLLSGSDRQYQPRLFGQAAFEATPATFQQLPHIFEAGIMTATPTSDTGSGFIRTYDAPTTAPGTPRTYTIEAGDNVHVERLDFGFIQEFTLAGSAGEAWTIAATWSGRQWTPAAFTPALTAPAVNEALFSRTSLFIAPTTDTLGTTDQIKSNSLLNATINVNTGFIPVFTADGELFFSFIKQVQPEITLEMTFEHNASALAERAFWRAGTARQIRLNVPGLPLAVPGLETTQRLTIDLAGKWESFEVLGEQDGNDIVSATFRARLNTEANLFARFVVVNEIAAL